MICGRVCFAGLVAGAFPGRARALVASSPPSTLSLPLVILTRVLQRPGARARGVRSVALGTRALDHRTDCLGYRLLDRKALTLRVLHHLSLIHISEPTRRTPISYAVFC